MQLYVLLDFESLKPYIPTSFDEEEKNNFDSLAVINILLHWTFLAKVGPNHSQLSIKARPNTWLPKTLISHQP